MERRGKKGERGGGRRIGNRKEGREGGREVEGRMRGGRGERGEGRWNETENYAVNAVGSHGTLKLGGFGFLLVKCLRRKYCVIQVCQ